MYWYRLVSFLAAFIISVAFDFFLIFSILAFMCVRLSAYLTYIYYILFIDDEIREANWMRQMGIMNRIHVIRVVRIWRVVVRIHVSISVHVSVWVSEINYLFIEKLLAFLLLLMCVAEKKPSQTVNFVKSDDCESDVFNLFSVFIFSSSLLIISQLNLISRILYQLVWKY